MRTYLAALAFLLFAGSAEAALFPTRTPSASGGGAREVMLEPQTATLPDTLFASILRVPGTNLTYLQGVFTNGVQQNMMWTFGVPSNYSGNVTITIYWNSAVADGTKNVAWLAGTRSVGLDGTWDSSFSLTSGTDANQGTANLLNEVAIVITSPWTAGQTGQLQVQRNGAAVADTLVAVVNLFHVKLSW